MLAEPPMAVVTPQSDIVPPGASLRWRPPLLISALVVVALAVVVAAAGIRRLGWVSRWFVFLAIRRRNAGTRGASLMNCYNSRRAMFPILRLRKPASLLVG